MEKHHTQDTNISISYQERRWLLYLLDALAINGGFILALYFRPDYSLTWQLILDYPEWFILLNGMWFFIGHLLQLFDIERAGHSRTAHLQVIGAVFVVNLLFNFVPFIPPKLPPSRQPLFFALLLPTLFMFIGRALYMEIFRHGRFQRRLLIIGAGWAGQTIFQALTEHAQTIYKVAGFIDDDAGKIGQQVDINKDDSGRVLSEPVAAPILGSSQEIMRIIEQYNVSTLVLAITWGASGDLYRVLTDCLQREVEVIPMPLLYEQLTGKIPVEHIGDHWSVSMPLEQPGTIMAWHALKRIFDLFWSSLGMIFLILVSPFIALAIKLESKGPILYTQERMGRNGKVFRVYKFRSMVEDAETDHAVWAQKDDPRITRVGRLLRKTHIDEFPQFWNILKGDMSVVGPRPERPEFINELAEEIPFYRVRLAVKPGMAGWGLIHQGYGASKEDALEKLQYDLYYVKHQSLWLDIYVLWRTVVDSLSFSGR